MNVEPDLPITDTAEPPAAADVDVPAPDAAKPVRRRRAAAKPAGEEVGVVAAVDVPAGAQEPPMAQAAPVRKRRRKPEAAVDEPSPAVIEAALQASQAAASLPTAFAEAVEAQVIVSSERSVASQESSATSSERDGEAEADVEAKPTFEVPPDASATPRFEGGRRGRRERRRGPRPDAPLQPLDAQALRAEDEDDDEAGASDATDAPPRPAPTDPAELFAQVLEGSFDREAEPAPVVEGQPAEGPQRRILPPDPDAPKLHKVLAQAGIGSRRDMEQLIADGAITVNGQPAHTGQRISFGDRIAVEGKLVKVRIAPPPPRILAYHKPAGEVVTNDDPQQRPTVFRKLPRLPHGKWQSVGRLDINTEGLLLFTNSGDLAHRLMHPRFGVEREYAVRILGKLDEDQKEELLDGVEVDGQEAKLVSIADGGGEGANHWYRVVITEGRNREVRKLFEAIGLTVSRLIRIRYGNVVLPRGLKRGVWVDLDGEDVKAVRRLAGSDFGPQQRQGDGGGKRGPQPPQHRGGGESRGPRRDGGYPPPQGGQPQPQEAQRERGLEDDEIDDFDPSRIPNPLEQTFDRRFSSNKRGGFSGFGNPNSPRGGGPAGRKGGGNPNEPRQPDPMQTSIGYIGADAFHRSGHKGPRGGGGGGGNRGGGGGGGGRGRRGR